jgi:hypothetical protein
MVRDEGGATPKRPTFGRIDPFCWVAVGSLLLLAGLLAFGGLLPVGIGVAVFAIGLAFFDSWVNRPGIPSAPRRTQQPRVAPPNATRARPRPPRRGQPAPSRDRRR